MASDPDDFREIGRVVGPHGVVGEFKVAPETDDPGRFLELATIYIGGDAGSLEHFDIVSARVQPSKFGKTIVIGVSGIADRVAVAALAKKRVFALESDLPPLQAKEFFVSDLIGLTVMAEAEGTLGEVIDVLDMPAQQILLTRLEDGREVMIPLISEFVTELDLEGGKILVALIDGML